MQTEAVRIKATIEAKLAQLGRDAAAFGFESIQQYSRGENRWPGDIAAWRNAGGSHISVVTMGANLTTVDGHIGAIKHWRDVYNAVDRASLSAVEDSRPAAVGWTDPEGRARISGRCCLPTTPRRQARLCRPRRHRPLHRRSRIPFLLVENDLRKPPAVEIWLNPREIHGAAPQPDD